ncbi:L-ascorbate metabolism protein UlaG, beta-lactamase superfamily [Paenibacillus sp. yr247]|uniref:MBL fold metallo-hydrolase n=1 Tax=Paenibacillus sp. yr247 TaxID=1761880 RepID=UPI000881301B|nr:MBL fold metallo-hydrolase [Paenibacillus sp. yr247]SDO08818.1 L-ascorbate metabolism protein UlaG, beta-lactamase superfamily [Paenibacillus sp. yr247]
MLLILTSIVIGIVIVFVLFMNVYPVFGQKPSKAKVQAFSRSSQYVNGKFQNPVPTMTDGSFKKTMGILLDFAKSSPNRRPKRPLAMETPSLIKDLETKVTWFGHSASLVAIEGKALLLDPMFGKAPSPFPRFGKGRYSGGLPFEIAQLPVIDAVLLSHDHYDHLDYGSIMKLKHKVNKFLVPLGVGSHLIRWGVQPDKIDEYDWWDEFTFEGLTLACTPATHFSGRSITDHGATLWCSWVIKGKQSNIFFSGDSGYAPHFKEIGQKYGPFDLTLMECGQYEERWADIHMMPEETVQAHIDVRGKLMIPIHWGAFTLSLHDWSDPVERATRAAHANNVPIATPKIGQTVLLHAMEYPKANWWK